MSIRTEAQPASPSLEEKVNARRQLMNKQKEDADYKKLAEFLKYVTNPDLIAGEIIEIYPEHPCGYGGEFIDVPYDWWKYIPEDHPTLISWLSGEHTKNQEVSWLPVTSEHPVFPENSTKEELAKAYVDWTEKKEEEEYRKKLAAFLCYVKKPNLIVNQTIQIYPGHPSGYGGERILVPKDWWNYISDSHPVWSTFSPPATSQTAE